jgi:hypothetical protein
LHETGIGEVLRCNRVGGELCEQVRVVEQPADAQRICAIAALIRSYTHKPVSEVKGFRLNDVPLAALTSS